MKSNFKIFIFGFLALTIISCTDRLEEINIDPNRQEASAADPGFLFAQAVHLPTYKENFAQQLGYITVFGSYSHYFVTLAPAAFPADAYTNANDFSDFGYWNVEWKAIPLLNQALASTDIGAEYENANNNAMIRIWKVYLLSRLTNAYGSIPFEESGNGANGIITPTYETQDVIYTKLFLELDRALSDLDSGIGGNFVTQDIIYDGDIDNWIKFGNSLRLRLAMRIRYADAALSQSEVTKAVNGGVFTSNGQNALNKSTTTQNNFQHPFWQISTSPAASGIKMSESFVEQLKGNTTYRNGGTTSGEDPRLEILIADNVNGEKQGIKNGYTSQFYGSNPQFTTEGSFAKYHNEPTRSVTIMGYAEVQFLLAEAALAGYAGVTGTEADYYRNGIEASIQDLGAEVGSFSDDEMALLEAAGSEEAKYERIMYQKWIAIFPDTHEAFAEQRRTGYPVIEKRSGANFSLGLTDGTIPNRIPYPQTERNANGANVSAAIEAQGGDDLLNKVWWDKRTVQDAWEQ